MARDATKYHRMARADDGFTDLQVKLGIINFLIILHVTPDHRQ